MTKLRKLKRRRKWPRFCYVEKATEEVLKLLQKHNNQDLDKEINLSLNFMAQQIEVSTPTIEKAIRNLSQKGVIRVISGKKKGNSNRYILAEKHL